MDILSKLIDSLNGVPFKQMFSLAFVRLSRDITEQTYKNALFVNDKNF